jgi:phage tail sheath protein FI
VHPDAKDRTIGEIERCRGGTVPEFVSPGVFIEEVPSGERPIVAVSSSVLGIVGVTMAGPVFDVTKVTSWQGFVDVFGRTDPVSFTAEAIWSFFHNGGAEAWVIKVPHPTVPDGIPEVATHDPDAVLAKVLVEGIGMLDGSSQVDLLICPDMLMVQDDRLRRSVIEAMTRFAEQHLRFAIVDLPPMSDDQLLVDWRSKLVTSSFAAAYAPHTEIVHLDPGASDRTRLVPPSGVVAGVCAQTDERRGVWKAPAGVEIHGVVGLGEDYTDARQDLLNPNAVNVIREFPQRGMMVWGARTVSSDPEWRYVAVRRLANMIERSIVEGTQWVVFEPNSEPLWASVRSSVESFLLDLWREGAVAGSKPKDAFFVRVGLGDTMTQSDVDGGRLNIIVGFAPLKPAEFVILRITHQF